MANIVRRKVSVALTCPQFLALMFTFDLSAGGTSTLRAINMVVSFNKSLLEEFPFVHAQTGVQILPTVPTSHRFQPI
ncbi:hypothetical protein ACOSQ2_018130 [Xanthoceras sorbifolium]